MYGAAASGSNLINYNVENGNGVLPTLADPVSAKDWLLDSHLEGVMLASVVLNSMAAGIIFIFSNTVMPSLATLDADVGINIMNKINVVIVNPLFIVAFFGGLISAYPTRVMMKNPDAYSKPARFYALASTLIFFFGEFMVTVTQNVPRNNALLAVDPDSDEGVEYWQNNFLKGWVAWNTARGFFATVSAVLGALSLAFMRKPQVG
mmetsp:Transcript_19048/g.26810  ORF Transcript_19048/g.26810 Transcript_19048/m.26810 type:complete len:206 (+) Transcript_19048:210-827(+)|eukprot:CAMPEP_0184857846 /NCGR_PEP_ID=MMETSP0580-20130426/2987_1 /TAXON_ID=1118495 /ORGANISM="Dactyliosolen fragilissimus" /LENGTH=205 /DNA_ID=CAMNT_0027353677 /DNA_START=105 /DNA_END=722 /DNA_ORIENTATION=-